MTNSSLHGIFILGTCFLWDGSWPSLRFRLNCRGSLCSVSATGNDSSFTSFTVLCIEDVASRGWNAAYREMIFEDELGAYECAGFWGLAVRAWLIEGF